LWLFIPRPRTPADNDARRQHPIPPPPPDTALPIMKLASFDILARSRQSPIATLPADPNWPCFSVLPSFSAQNAGNWLRLAHSALERQWSGSARVELALFSTAPSFSGQERGKLGSFGAPTAGGEPAEPADWVRLPFPTVAFQAPLPRIPNLQSPIRNRRPPPSQIGRLRHSPHPSLRIPNPQSQIPNPNPLYLCSINTTRSPRRQGKTRPWDGGRRADVDRSLGRNQEDTRAGTLRRRGKRRPARISSAARQSEGKDRGQAGARYGGDGGHRCRGYWGQSPI